MDGLFMIVFSFCVLFTSYAPATIIVSGFVHEPTISTTKSKKKITNGSTLRLPRGDTFLLLSGSETAEEDKHRNMLLAERKEEEEAVLSTTTPSKTTHLVFPGGGLFFYWQAGAVTYLREQGYNLTDTCTAAGASAGALTATCTLTDVDFYRATELALDMSRKAGVWDRQGGLQGIWGPLIYDWLDELLPQNALDRVQNNNNDMSGSSSSSSKLSLLVTPVPSFGKDVITEFNSRKDLIECNMASVHLPWFLDGKLTSTFRGRPHIDGSFLSKEENYLPSSPSSSSIITFDWTEDPVYKSRGFFDFVNAGLSPDTVLGILEQGKSYARIMEEQGRFESLPPKKNIQN